MAWDGQGGRNFAGPIQKNAGLRGLSSLDVIIQGGYLPIGSGPVEYAAWLRQPVDYIVANVNQVILDALAAVSEPIISAAQGYSLAAGNFASIATSAASTATDGATQADASKTAAAASATAAAASYASVLANKASVAEVRAATDDTKYPTALGLGASQAFVASTGGEISSGTVTFNMALGFNRKHTQTVNTTLAAPTNLLDGGSYTIMVIGAGFTMAALPAYFDFGTATTPVFNTAAGKINKIYFQHDAVANKGQATFWRQ